MIKGAATKFYGTRDILLWQGRPIDQFWFLPPIIAWSVFSQADR
jgi:hypothetical protein